MNAIIRLIVFLIAFGFCLSTTLAVLDLNKKSKKVDTLRAEVADLKNYQKDLIKDLSYRKTNEFREKEAQRVSFDHPGIVEQLEAQKETKSQGPQVTTPQRWLKVLGF